MSKFTRAAYIAKSNESRPTFEVTMPSGAEFTLRRVNLAAFLQSGQLPDSFVAKLVKMGGKSQTELEAIASEMSVDERLADLRFTGLIVKDALVSPRISHDPKEDDEIAFSELEDADMQFIIQWAFQSQMGGVEGENVAKFRGKQTGNAPVGVPGETHEHTAVEKASA